VEVRAVELVRISADWNAVSGVSARACSKPETRKPEKQPSYHSSWVIWWHQHNAGNAAPPTRIFALITILVSLAGLAWALHGVSWEPNWVERSANWNWRWIAVRRTGRPGGLCDSGLGAGACCSGLWALCRSGSANPSDLCRPVR